MTLVSNIPEDFSIIKASGNGSCGPNAMAIIFSNYLLSGLINDNEIELSELFLAWNLYYENDQIALENPENSIRQKLISKIQESENFSFKDCEALFAPLIRFYYILYTKINSDSEFNVHEQSPKKLNNLFDVDDKLNMLAQAIKRSMSKKEILTSLSNGTRTDNSPAYTTFFNADAMKVTSEQLLGIELHYSLSGPYRGSHAAYDRDIELLLKVRQEETKDIETLKCHMTRDTIAWTGPNSAESIRKENGLLPGFIINYQNVHFDAILPKSMLAMAHIAKLKKNMEANKRHIMKSDQEIYNPSNLPQPARQVKLNSARTPFFGIKFNAMFGEIRKKLDITVGKIRTACGNFYAFFRRNIKARKYGKYIEAESLLQMSANAIIFILILRLCYIYAPVTTLLTIAASVIWAHGAKIQRHCLELTKIQIYSTTSSQTFKTKENQGKRKDHTNKQSWLPEWVTGLSSTMKLW